MPREHRVRPGADRSLPIAAAMTAVDHSAAIGRAGRSGAPNSRCPIARTGRSSDCASDQRDPHRCEAQPHRAPVTADRPRQQQLPRRCDQRSAPLRASTMNLAASRVGPGPSATAAPSTSQRPSSSRPPFTTRKPASRPRHPDLPRQAARARPSEIMPAAPIRRCRSPRSSAEPRASATHPRRPITGWPEHMCGWTLALTPERAAADNLCIPALPSKLSEGRTNRRWTHEDPREGETQPPRDICKVTLIFSQDTRTWQPRSI